MLYNKAQYKKLDDTKALHKKGKRWIVVSVALLGAMSTGAFLSHSTANADSVNASSRVTQQLSNTNQTSSSTASVSQASSEAISSVPKVNVSSSANDQRVSSDTQMNDQNDALHQVRSVNNSNTVDHNNVSQQSMPNGSSSRTATMHQGTVNGRVNPATRSSAINHQQGLKQPKVSHFVNQRIHHVGSTLGEVHKDDIPTGYRHVRAGNLQQNHPQLYSVFQQQLKGASPDIPVVGNPVSYKGTVTLHFHEPDGTDVKDIQLPYMVNSEVGNQVTLFDPSTYLNQTIQGFSTAGFTNDAQKGNFTFEVQPSDGPQHNGNVVQKNYTLAFTAKSSAPITVTYHDQNGKKFTSNVSGYVDQQGHDITQLANVPAGYSLNGGQNTNYMFKTTPQNMDENITGNPQSGTVAVTINKLSHGQTVGTYTRQVSESGKTGNSFTINPNTLTPTGYAPQSSPAVGQFTPNGLSFYNTTFNYDADRGATVTVDYLNQNNQNVGTGSINGPVDQSGSVISKVAVPNGYTANNGQNTNYKITRSPQTFNIHVTGNNANTLLDKGQAHIMIEKQVNGQVISDTPQTVQVNGHVGDNYLVNPSNYIPTGYSSISQPLQGTITANGLSNGSAKFVYTANASDPLILSYKNQDGNVVSNSTLNGTVDKTIDVTKPSDGGAGIPAGYTLNPGQKTDYTFTVRPQNIVLNVTGIQHGPNNPKAGNYNVLVNLVAERPTGNNTFTTQGMFHKTVTVPESGRTGDTYSISATDPNIVSNIPGYGTDFVPTKQDSDLNGQFTSNGLSNAQGTFVYLAKAEQNGGITVNYIDQNGQQVGSGIIRGYAGQTIDDVTNTGDNGIAIPNGYTYASGNKRYTIGDSMRVAQITVVGNKISGTEHLTLHFNEPDGTQVNTIKKDVPVNGRVGDKDMTINPNDYNQNGFNVSSKPAIIKFTFNKSKGTYSGNTSFNYTAKEAAPITVIYTNQNGQTVAHNVNGYFDQQGKDISKLDNVPAGYSLNNGQNLNYKFSLVPQSIKAKVTGDQQSGTVNITINKRSNGKLVNTSHRQDKVSGITGNTYSVNPSDYTPQGYAPQDSPMTGDFVADGISKPNVTFNYDANAGAAITVNFINQDKQNVGSGTILGNIDATGAAQDKVKVPKGYQLVAGQNTSYKVTNKPQSMSLNVLGESAQNLADGGKVQVTVIKKSNDTQVGTPQTMSVPVKSRVGDSYMINPTDYTPSGYTSISQPLQGTVESNGLSQDKVSFVYTANASAPINVTYINQNKQRVGDGVINGSVDQRADATQDVPVPAGYTLNGGQNTDVTFTTSPQTFTYNVTGTEHSQNDSDAKNYQFLLHLNVVTVKGSQIFSKDVTVPEFGKTGDDFLISPMDPSFTKEIPNYSTKAFEMSSSDKPINGEITNDGLTDKNGTFTYIDVAQTDANNPSDPNALAKPIHVIYQTADGNQLGDGYVNGYLDQTIQDVTNPADGGVDIPKGYQYASGDKTYTISTHPQKANIIASETTADSDSHKDATATGSDAAQVDSYTNDASSYASGTASIASIANSINSDTPDNTAKSEVSSDDSRIHQDDSQASNDAALASSDDSEADSLAQDASSAAGNDNESEASADETSAASLASSASETTGDAESAYFDASEALNDASMASASASSSADASASASASLSASESTSASLSANDSKAASLSASASASLSASISASESASVSASASAAKAASLSASISASASAAEAARKRSKSVSPAALSSASTNASAASASADSYTNDAERYAADASAVDKQADAIGSVASPAVENRIQSDVSDIDSDAEQASEDNDFADRADSRADSYAADASHAAMDGNLSLAQNDASHAASEAGLTKVLTADARAEDIKAHSAMSDASDTLNGYNSMQQSNSAVIAHVANGDVSEASSAVANTSSVASDYPNDKGIASDKSRAASDSSAVTLAASAANSYAAKGDMSDADREAGAANSFAADASAAASDADSRGHFDSVNAAKAQAASARAVAAKAAAEKQKKLDDAKFKKQLVKDEAAYRNAFDRGFHDAEYAHKIIKSHFGGQKKAYMAGYEAYYNGFCEGAQGKQAMNGYYQGFSRDAFMNGYLNGAKYTAQNGTQSISKDLTAHNAIANMTMDHDDKLSHYIHQNGKLPQTSESTPVASIVMAIALGIGALSMLGYDDIRKRYENEINNK